MTARSIWIGFDDRETAAFMVARESIRRQLSKPIPIFGLVLPRLISAGLYWRQTETRVDPQTGVEQKWDVISDAPVSTDFSNSRWLVTHLARSGRALFLDCDMLVRADLNDLFDIIERPENEKYAVMCVKHDHRPAETVKMDGQIQTAYGRKNWSSVVLWNLDSLAHRALTLEAINERPGRELHQFFWLDDDQIGALNVEWNWLAGISDPTVDPKIVHHTDGSPFMKGYENTPFADEWCERLYDSAERET